MVALAALVRLPVKAVLAIGIAIVAGHNLLDPVKASWFGAWAPAWLLLHEQGPIVRDGQIVVVVFYPLLAWIGVMALGYGLGPVFLSPRRDRTLVRLAWRCSRSSRCCVGSTCTVTCGPGHRRPRQARR